LAAIAFVGFAFTSQAHAKEVVQLTSCNQFLQNVVADLQNDLNCSNVSRTAVHLTNSDLLLNGHTITGPAEPLVGFGVAGVVHCNEKCRIIGAGTIAEGEAAITTGPSAKLTVEDVEMRDNAIIGVSAVGEGRAKLTGVSILNSGGCAYIGEGLILRESTVSGNQCGIWVSGGGLKVFDSEVTDNIGSPDYLFGVFSGKPKIKGSTITGNGVDVRSNLKPAFRDSTCEVSLDQVNNVPWGFCTLDE